MSEIQRYQHTCGLFCWGMEIDPNGTLCTYADHAAAISAKDAEIARWREQSERLLNEIDRIKTLADRAVHEDGLYADACREILGYEPSEIWKEGE